MTEIARVTQDDMAAELAKLAPRLVPTAPPKLCTAIAAVMTEIGVVAKEGVNQFFNYKYAAIGDVLEKLTPLLGKHGIIIMQYEHAKSLMDDGKVVCMEYRFSLAHVSGEVWPDQPIFTGVSNCRNRNGTFDDKCLNKCHTAARKYFLMSLFQIPTGDVDDADKGDNDGAGAGGRRPQARPDAMRPQAEPEPYHPSREPAPPPPDAVNQETGEIGPYAIPTANRRMGDFAADYTAGITSARNMTEFLEWQMMNAEALTTMEQKAPAMHGRIVALHQKKVQELTGTQEAANDPH